MAPSSPDSISFHNSDDNDNGNDRFARLMRDTRTKMEAKKLELNATMQEKLPEWKLRGAMYSQYARETGIEWSRKGKETVDRWKKELAERGKYIISHTYANTHTHKYIYIYILSL